MLKRRQRHASNGETLAALLDLLLAELVAMARVMNEELVLVQRRPEPRAMARLGLRAKVQQQRFDLAPSLRQCVEC